GRRSPTGATAAWWSRTACSIRRPPWTRASACGPESGGLLLEHRLERKLEPRQECRGQRVAGFAGELGGAGEGVSGPAIDLECLELRIDHPVFEDTAAVVEPALGDFVGLAGSRREDRDNQVLSSLDVLLRQDLSVLVGDVQEVRLNDVEVGEDHVERRQEDATDGMALQVLA